MKQFAQRKEGTYKRNLISNDMHLISPLSQTGSSGIRFWLIGLFLFISQALFIHGETLLNGANCVGTIETPDQIDTWTFEANEGDYIRINVTGENFTPSTTFYDPDGIEHYLPSYAYKPFIASQSGSYTLTVSSGYTGSYTARLVIIPSQELIISPGDEGGPCTFGQTYTGQINNGDIDLWKFNAVAGNTYYFALSAFRTHISVYIRDQIGNTIYTNYSTLGNQKAKFVAPSSGEYTIEFYSTPTGNFSLSYSFQIIPINDYIAIPEGDEGGTITQNASYTGAIGAADFDPWQFHLEAGQEVVLRAYNPDIKTELDLFNPDGSLAATVTQNDALIVHFAEQTGTYTALISAESPSSTGNYMLTTAIANYNFIIPDGDEGGNLVNGANKTGRLSSGDIDTWSFQATEGEFVNISAAQYPYTACYFMVYKPDGTPLETDYLNISQYGFSAPQAGTYTILLTTYTPNTSCEYTLRRASISESFIIEENDEGGLINSGSYIRGSIPRGDLDLWWVSASAEKEIRIYQPAVNVFIDLFSPSGTYLGRLGDQSTIVPYYSFTPTETGNYFLLIYYYNTGSSRDYSLYLANTSDPWEAWLISVKDLAFGYHFYPYPDENYKSTYWGPMADPDHDGICNLQEFYLGTSPFEINKVNQPLSIVERDGSVFIEHRRQKSAAEHGHIEFSTDLLHWSSEGIIYLPPIIEDNFETITAKITPKEHSKLFFRLKIATP